MTEPQGEIIRTGTPPIWYEVGKYYGDVLCVSNVPHRLLPFVARKVTFRRKDGTEYVNFYNTN